MNRLQTELHKLYGSKTGNTGDPHSKQHDDPFDPKKYVEEVRAGQMHRTQQELIRAKDALIGIEIAAEILSQWFPLLVARIEAHRRPPTNSPTTPEGSPLVHGVSVYLTDELRKLTKQEKIEILINAQQPPRQFYSKKDRPLEIDPNTSDSFIVAMIALYILAVLNVEHAWTPLTQTATSDSTIDPHAKIDFSKIHNPECSEKLRHAMELFEKDLIKVVRSQLLTVIRSDQYALIRRIQKEQNSRKNKSKRK